MQASEVLIGKSYGGPPSVSYGYSFAFFPDSAFNFAMASGGAFFGDTATFQMATSQTVIDTIRWHYIVAVVKRSSNSECALYIDGNRVAIAFKGNVMGVQECLNNLDFLIGIQGDGRLPFKGMIDETVVADQARSADWIQLCYMNQRLPDALVRFGQ
jgi:Concanavalin A-like lectin/glucanases superfamily